MASLAGVTIYPTPDGGDTGWMSDPTKAVHTPIGATSSTIHYVNSPSYRRRVTALVRTQANHNSLIAATAGSANASLVLDSETVTVNILRMASTRVNDASGTVWYRCTWDLMQQ